MLSIEPRGYKVALHSKTNIGVILEMIPEGESLDRWTEMLTVQVMRNINRYTSASFYADMKTALSGMCPCGSTTIVELGREQRQPTLLWAHRCPLNEHTGQPENTWFKVLIRGGNIVVAQKAFKFEPSAEAVAFWLDFLRKLRVNHTLESLH